MTRVCWMLCSRELSMPASPLGETRTLAPIVRILVTRRDRELPEDTREPEFSLYSTSREIIASRTHASHPLSRRSAFALKRTSSQRMVGRNQRKTSGIRWEAFWLSRSFFSPQLLCSCAPVLV